MLPHDGWWMIKWWKERTVKITGNERMKVGRKHLLEQRFSSLNQEGGVGWPRESRKGRILKRLIMTIEVWGLIWKVKGKKQEIQKGSSFPVEKRKLWFCFLFGFFPHRKTDWWASFKNGIEDRLREDLSSHACHVNGDASSCIKFRHVYIYLL